MLKIAVLTISSVLVHILQQTYSQYIMHHWLARSDAPLFGVRITSSLSLFQKKATARKQTRVSSSIAAIFSSVIMWIVVIKYPMSTALASLTHRRGCTFHNPVKLLLAQVFGELLVHHWCSAFFTKLSTRRSSLVESRVLMDIPLIDGPEILLSSYLRSRNLNWMGQ